MIIEILSSSHTALLMADAKNAFLITGDDNRSFRSKTIYIAQQPEDEQPPI